MTWREITAAQLNNLRRPLIVDVRSPGEHAAENIVGAINLPLLSNEERATVGTIYAQQGELVARRQALGIIAPKIPEIIETIVTLRATGQAIVIHCWRGGLRSEAVASMLSVVGIDCFRLSGGYKSWRKQVLTDLQNNSYRFRPVVLHGLTGVGKTVILQELRALSFSVLDLEQLANHRGSAFGGMGLEAQPTQKNFEAALWQQLRSFDNELVFMEAESRKIGKLALPDCTIQWIRTGQRLLVTSEIETRCARIIADYAGALNDNERQQAIAQLLGLKERLGTQRVLEIQEMFLAGNLAHAVAALLLEYYDPLYSSQIEQAHPFELTVDGGLPRAAAQAIAQWARRNLAV